MLFAAFLSYKARNGFYKNLFPGVIVLASLTFALGILEIGLYLNASNSEKFPQPPSFLVKRRGNPHHLVQNNIFYIAPPKGVFRTFGHLFSTNRLGFRERDFSDKKPEGIFRILAFGDSITFGVGVADEHRYTNMLEDMLNIAAGEKKFEVLNFGMGGYSPDQELDLMKAVLPMVQADLIVVGFCCDDLKMTTKSSLKSFVEPQRISFGDLEGKINIFENFGGTFEGLPETEPDNFFSGKPWYEETRIFRILEKRTNLNKNKSLPNRNRWNYFLQQMMGMLTLTEKYNLPSPIVTLLYHGSKNPFQNDFVQPKGELAQSIQLYQFVRTRLEKKGFVIADPLETFKLYSGMSLVVSEWEWHPNYLGHYAYAKTLFDTLKSKGLIPL